VLGKSSSPISVISMDSAMPLKIILLGLHLQPQRQWLPRTVSAVGMPHAGISLAAHSCPLANTFTSKIQPTNRILSIFQLKKIYILPLPFLFQDTCSQLDAVGPMAAKSSAHKGGINGKDFLNQLKKYHL